MAKETILWAVLVGAEDWQEQVVTSTADAQHLAAARQWAVANGFDRLRESTYNGERPDFAGTVR